MSATGARALHRRGSNETTLPLFVYGTLADPATLDRLLGQSSRRRLAPAELPDYEKVWVAGFEYPFVARRSGSRVSGLLVEGLAPADYAVLDDYEGVEEEDYRRERVRVRVRAGVRDAEADAFVYAIGRRWERAPRSAR